jgi:hypothetical protein
MSAEIRILPKPLKVEYTHAEKDQISKTWPEHTIDEILRSNFLGLNHDLLPRMV